MQRFTRFVIVGGIGFAVDVGVLWLLIKATPLDAFGARIVAIAAALAVTWQLNRRLTFGPSDRHVAVEGARYGGVGLASALFNYTVYAVLLMAVPALHPIYALAIASASATAFSFAGYSKLVFTRRE